MSKNANFVSHKKSKQKNQDGSPKLPVASALVEGEIAVNFGKDVETLSIKNESGDVVTFSSDNYYTEKKLGSGFTGENSGVTVTEAIENSEEVLISSGVTPSGTSVEIWIDESEDPIEVDMYTKAQTDSLLNLKLDASAYAEYWTSGTGENAVVLKNSSGTASGDFSVAEGYQTSATRNYSHAEGSGTTASGSHSHAEGQGSKANGSSSHAEGRETTANGPYSHVEGYATTANSNSSHAEGLYTLANNDSEHASGMYNISRTGSTESTITLFTVGNGTADNARHNAFEIRRNGDIYIVNKDGNNVKLQDEIGNIDVDQTIDSGTSASTNAVSTSAVYGFVTSYTPSITVDQVLDYTTRSSTNPVSSKAVYKAMIDNELVWTNAFVSLSGIVSAHTENTEIHVTAADKEKLHTHDNKSLLDAITGNVGTMAYENASSYSSATQVNTALSGKSGTGHTHNYAGSSTAGGAATSAAKLTNTTAIGSATQPVFFTANGVPSACTYTLGKSVPSDAIFTDNNTTYAAGSFITITGDNNTINVSTGTSSSTVAVGNHNHSGVYQPVGNYLTAITSSNVTTALGYTPTNVHYSKVSVTGNLTNVTCPVTLSTNGEQCNVLYVNNSTEHTVSVSTNYKSPDNSQISLTIKANGYAEVNYLYFDGDIYVRGM